MSRFVDRRKKADDQASPGDFLKVLIPVERGVFDGPCEGIWVIVLDGDATAGHGVIDSDLIKCMWAKCGDMVTYREVFAHQVAYVTGLLQ